MSLRIARRMERIGTEGAFVVLAQARALEAEGRDIIHLEIGEPDFATPDNITDAAVAAMRGGETHYTPAGGIPAVRVATAAYLQRRTGVDIGPENVVLTPGSKHLLHFALLCCIEDGDEVLIPDPGYPIYRSLVSFVGGVSVPVPIRERNDFRLDPEELRALVTPRTRMIILNTPANPTGGVMTREDVEAVAAVARDHDLVVVSDEIYQRVLYDGDHHSIYSIDGMAERTVLMDGASKAWAMCGWRLGFGAMPLDLARRFETLMINTSSCTAAFTQLAAVEAFEAAASDTAVDAMVEEFCGRRDMLVTGLNAIPGIRCNRPRGAFYVFPNIEGTGRDERALAHALLHEAGVAVLPGTAFGSHGAGHIRLSYANSVANLERALERIRAYLGAPAPAGV